MDNQHKKITGYRDLSQEEIDLMNEVKLKASEVGELMLRLQSNEDLDQRWAATATTDLQVGFMKAVRAIAQPTTF